MCAAQDAALNGSTTESWYAVALQPHADALAKAHLERQGFSIFAPTLLRTVRHARQFISKAAPLFPGYLFVRIDVDRARWRSINGTRGVRGLVSTADGPIPVPKRAMNELLWASEVGEPLEAGAALEIVSGPFAGLTARLQRLDGASRVAVLMELIGGRLSVSLPRASVRAAG